MIITVLFGMKIVRERTVYTAEKKNPLVGFVDIIKNKYAWTIIISEFLKRTVLSPYVYIIPWIQKQFP